MKFTTLALYENESKYDDEFKNNLNECIQEFYNLYKGEQSDDLICVCAPGISFFLFSNKKLKLDNFWLTLLFFRKSKFDRRAYRL